MPIAPARQRARIPDQQIPQVAAHRLDLTPRRVHDDERSEPAFARNHRPDPRQINSAAHEVRVRTTNPINLKHKTRWSTHPGCQRHLVNELVQSTDQAWHGAWVFVAALIIAV
ncbi:hypothetical protein [Thermomonospora umbrina]|uniref:hypothetical protein n=1 Tax=Thermomonospora umbrina TaxID=111806 RepID=UPI001476CC73|nr:hypothetical protein [Thermomonospora umbrina]